MGPVAGGGGGSTSSSDSEYDDADDSEEDVDGDDSDEEVDPNDLSFPPELLKSWTMKCNTQLPEPFGTPSQTTLEKCINPLNAVQDLVLILPSDLIKKLKDKRGDPRGLQWGKNDRYNNKLSNNPRTRFIDVIVEDFMADFACAGVALKVHHGRKVDRATFTIDCKHGGDPSRSHHAGEACGSRKATSLADCGWKLSFTTIFQTATHTATNTEASFSVL